MNNKNKKLILLSLIVLYSLQLNPIFYSMSLLIMVVFSAIILLQLRKSSADLDLSKSKIHFYVLIFLLLYEFVTFVNTKSLGSSKFLYLNGFLATFRIAISVYSCHYLVCKIFKPVENENSQQGIVFSKLNNSIKIYHYIFIVMIISTLIAIIIPITSMTFAFLSMAFLIVSLIAVCLLPIYPIIICIKLYKLFKFL